MTANETRVTLGARMRANIAEEIRNPVEAARKKAMARDANTLKRFLAAEQFLVDAKKSIELAIVAGDKPAMIRMPYEVSEAFGLTYSIPKATDFPANSLAYPLAREFSQWAQDEELQYALKYCHDGGGIESWWELAIKVPLDVKV